MTYFAGIDGGQSSTTAIVADERGRILGRGVCGPADEVGEGAASTRMHDALAGALCAACDNAGIPAATHFDAIVAGVSGYEGRVYGKAPQLPATRFVLMHDAPIAHAGALGGEPGVIVIAGTGSVVYATDGKRGWTLGGWGYLFGDEGSAFWLAREALAEFMRHEESGNHPDLAAESELACKWFGLPSLRAIARAFYAGELSRERVAAFTKEVLKRPYARDVVRRGASRLGDLVLEALAQGAAPKVACVGGMFADERYAGLVRSFIAKWPPGVRIVEPRYEPAAGALLLAFREGGTNVAEIAS